MEPQEQLKKSLNPVVMPNSKSLFQLVSNYGPAGDQSQAIQTLIESYTQKNKKRLCLLGVTGSGKTYTMASFIAGINKPTLVLTHNKTLAAQLFREFSSFFPHNAVEYFVSYYNYYQPEAYVPVSDTFIEKDSSINDEIDRLRLRATSALLERQDVIIVASVSCIYGLGSPEDYQHSLVVLDTGVELDRNELIKKLLHIQYKRNDIEIERGNFRVRGDTLEIFPAYRDEGIRIEWFGDEIERVCLMDPMSGKPLQTLDRAVIYPARHFITSEAKVKRAIATIKEELESQLHSFKEHGKLLEAERIAMRTNFDLEMLDEIGYCNGVENYSRHLTGRAPGEPPACLLDYFNLQNEGGFLTIIDESHVSVPQLRGMYEGDRSRKRTLVDYGFRLPSALDNRPLRYEEFDKMAKSILYVSATPSQHDLDQAEVTVEQIVRPTGLLDPEVEVRPSADQIEDIYKEIQKCIKKKQRVLITTLTKKMSEDLSDYLKELKVKVAYLHSEIKTIERVGLLRDLRSGIYDTLVGVNLLREGLDLPEVSLVCILDADKEGFLRNARSLIQTIGRAARNVDAKAILYANKMTPSMDEAIKRSKRNRNIQMEYNKTHGIVPQTIKKNIHDMLEDTSQNTKEKEAMQAIKKELRQLESQPLTMRMETLKQNMLFAAKNLDFEKAAMLRDEIDRIKPKERPKQKPKAEKKPIPLRKTR